jgi:predicted phage tail protein
MAAGSASDAKRDCPGGACTSASAVDAAENGMTMGTVSTIAFAVGAAGVGLGVYGLLSPKKSTSSASATVHLAPTGASLRGRF